MISLFTFITNDFVRISFKIFLELNLLNYNFFVKKIFHLSLLSVLAFGATQNPF